MGTEIKLKGDKVIELIPSIKETVRHFFRSGGSSGTIAKAMSAYDKDFSDAVYGAENDGRYVTEERLKKMLTHEGQII